jgi:hypothetical protein
MLAQYILDAAAAAENLGPIPTALPLISMPPCTTCKHFLPQARADSSGSTISVQLCLAPHPQERDFSCYDPQT